MINKLNEVRANVAAFLGSNNSVMDVLNSGDDAQIQQLVQLFQGGALG